MTTIVSGREYGEREDRAVDEPGRYPCWLRRNRWFCRIDDPFLVPLRHLIGVENIMVESDYPHADSTWPNTSDCIETNFGHLPQEIIRKVTLENAASLFGVEIPAGI